MASYTVPRALEEHEIQSYIQDYVTAAENAIKTGGRLCSLQHTSGVSCTVPLSCAPEDMVVFWADKCCVHAQQDSMAWKYMVPTAT